MKIPSPSEVDTIRESLKSDYLGKWKEAALSVIQRAFANVHTKGYPEDQVNLWADADLTDAIVQVLAESGWVRGQHYEIQPTPRADFSNELRFKRIPDVTVRT